MYWIWYHFHSTLHTWPLAGRVGVPLWSHIPSTWVPLNHLKSHDGLNFLKKRIAASFREKAWFEATNQIRRRFLCLIWPGHPYWLRWDSKPSSKPTTWYHDLWLILGFYSKLPVQSENKNIEPSNMNVSTSSWMSSTVKSSFIFLLSSSVSRNALRFVIVLPCSLYSRDLSIITLKLRN